MPYVPLFLNRTIADERGHQGQGKEQKPLFQTTMIRNQITDEFPSDSKETLNEEEQGEESIKVGKESMEKSRKGLDLGERTSADGNGENFKFYGKKGHCSSNSIPPQTSSDAIQTSSNTQQQQDSKAFEKRKRIMTEIVDTEIRYVADLILLKVFSTVRDPF